jgi:hypothetical protein
MFVSSIGYYRVFTLRPCLFVLLLLNFWKSWLMASWIAGCLILGVGFCNIYLVFLHTKSLKIRSRWAFQLLVHFFRSLLFSVPKASWKVCRLFLLLPSQLFGWKSQLRSKNKQGLNLRDSRIFILDPMTTWIIDKEDQMKRFSHALKQTEENIARVVRLKHSNYEGKIWQHCITDNVTSASR